jgi:hypothetical protein
MQQLEIEDIEKQCISSWDEYILISDAKQLDDNLKKKP